MSQVLIDADELAELRDDAQCARDIVAALASKRIEASDPTALVQILEALSSALFMVAARQAIRQAKKVPT